ncbi:GGDEF domain-containing protein [Pollutimonas subterranea]|nr:GGDEF domain-containing protein [Pollutimonas subterranea]
MNDVAGFTNISDQLQYEKRLSQLELRDGPTGLANRNLLTERTNQALLQAERYGRSLGMLCICLDGFNEVNNIHAGDDELLKLVAQQLVASVRATDTVARITANEFVVLLPEIEDADHVLLVAAKIAKSLDELSTLNVGTSIGVARYPTDGQDMPGLLRHADEDRFRNKPRLLSSV